MTEQKILLAKHGSRSLFLFKRIYPKSVHTEYVIAYYKGSAKKSKTGIMVTTLTI